MCVSGAYLKNWEHCDFSFVLRDGIGLHRDMTVYLKGVLSKKPCLGNILSISLSSILLSWIHIYIYNSW